ncbi:hypothetical protein CSUI_011410, partial [Cystoisospora suis]
MRSKGDGMASSLRPSRLSYGDHHHHHSCYPSQKFGLYSDTHQKQDDVQWMRSIECFLDDLSFCPSASLVPPTTHNPQLFSSSHSLLHHSSTMTSSTTNTTTTTTPPSAVTMTGQP